MEHTSKLKLKIGTHEFEAEGPPELVKEQLEAFKALIAIAAVAATTPPPQTVIAAPPAGALSTTGLAPSMTMAASVEDAAAIIDANLSRIMRVEDRVVSLTIKPQSVGEAVLLLLYGQKAIRSNDSVTGAEVIDGLTATGLRVGRVDRLLEKCGEEGDVIVIGTGRAKRYRLTNAGMANARKFAGEHLKTVA